MRILHFSDTHGNQRAIDALCCTAANWNDASVAITGDLCKKNSSASSEFDELANPNIWIVPGNHDFPQMRLLGHLSRAQWRAPYSSETGSCFVVGLDSESRDGAEEQLISLRNSSQSEEKRTLVVLHHRPFSPILTKAIVSWGKSRFPALVSVALLHGHEHHRKDFFAETVKDRVDEINVITSNVYTANTRFGLGCANLLSIQTDGSITSQTVHDPSEMIVEDGFVRRRSKPDLQPGWRIGEDGSPMRKLEDCEDTLVVIDDYWRGLARDRFGT